MSELYLQAPGASVKPDERRFLKELAERASETFGNPVIVNIGVWKGCTMHALRAGAPGAYLVGVDIDLGQRDVWRQSELEPVEFIQGDSAAIGKRFGRTAHLVFIDGDHSYEQVKADIEAWTPHIPPGGIIAFHDYAPTERDRKQFGLEGVKDAVNEWYLDNNIFLHADLIGSITAFIKVRVD